MWHCEGMEWRAPYTPTSISDSSHEHPASDKAIRQRITIAPHGARWMFALDRPFGMHPGAMLARGNYLYSVQPIRKTRRYEVLSSTEPIGKELSAYERREALQLPASISPAVRELAASLAAHDSEPRATVNQRPPVFSDPRIPLFIVTWRIQQERSGGISLSSSNRLLRTLRCQFRYSDAAGWNSGAGRDRLSGRRIQ